MKNLFVACALLFVCNLLRAQQFGGNPAYIEWRQINTDAARVIYPEGLDSIAQRIQAIVNYMHKNYSSTIGEKLRKINIVLQSNTSVTNGYVALAPYRREFYLMPPQNAFELGAKSEDVSNRFNMKPTVGLAIFQLPDANALETADLVKAKIKGEKIVTPEFAEPPPVVDLMAALKKSLETIKPPASSKPSRAREEAEEKKAAPKKAQAKKDQTAAPKAKARRAG